MTARHTAGLRPLTVFDHTLRGFGFQITEDDMRIWFVRVLRKLGPTDVVLGTPANLTGAVAWARARAETERRERAGDCTTGPTAARGSLRDVRSDLFPDLAAVIS